MGKKGKVVGLKRYYSTISGPSTNTSGTVAAPTVEQSDAAPGEEDDGHISARALETQAEAAEQEQPPQVQGLQQGIQLEECEYIKEFNPDHIIADPGFRIPIEKFHPDIRDQVKRAYLLKGPTQPIGHTFPRKLYGTKDYRSFREIWFQMYDWLEYSVAKDAAYCFYCFLFKEQPSDGQFGHDAFTKLGFNTWKNAYKALPLHVGGIDSLHTTARKACEDFKNPRSSVATKLRNYSKESEMKYKIRLTAALDCARYLLMQGHAFRGHDESSSSLNKGNYLEMIDWYKEKKEDVRDAFDELCPANCQMLAPSIQRDLAQCCAEEVTEVIMGEIGHGVYSILIDESRDISIKEQMAMIVRFVNSKGKVMERFLGLQHVKDTSSDALKRAFVEMLGKHKLPIARLRGQGYDGASNMRGIKDFFDYVNLIVTSTSASCKRKDILTEQHHNNITNRLESGEIFSGRGKHQDTSLVRPGDTRWGSHYTTLLRIELMWDAVIPVLIFVNQDQRRATNAGGLIHIMESFNFVFILKMMLKLFRITNELSLLLQRRDQNIVQAMSLLVDVKARLINLRNNGWEPLLAEVQKFCDEKKIEIPNMDAPRPRWGRSRKEKGIMVTEGHHYHVDTFYAAIDAINTEMNHRFNEVSSELLVCFSCLDPRDSFSKFNVDKLARLAEIYDADFSHTDRATIKDQLETFIIHVRRVDYFIACQDLGSLAVKMVETEKHVAFPLVYRLIELALLLPVATASVERVFSAMNIIKTDLRNKIANEWLNDLMICYTEREIFKGLDNERIMKRFQAIKNRRMNLPRSPRCN